VAGATGRQHVIHLYERQFGFDPKAIGFPSILGCHAVVYVTAEGLYGFHNAGGSGKDHWKPRGEWLATFTKGTTKPAGKGLSLYGTCSRGTTNNRGYTMATKMQDWTSEMKAYAEALGFKGKLAGYDLDKNAWATTHSTYVEYRKDGDKITVHVSKWPKPPAEPSTGYDVETKLPTTTDEKKNWRTVDNAGKPADLTQVKHCYTKIKPKSGYELVDITSKLDLLTL
jgi:hypothetical protein